MYSGMFTKNHDIPGVFAGIVELVCCHFCQAASLVPSIVGNLDGPIFIGHCGSVRERNVDRLYIQV